jgi:hypothetical protein
MKSRKLFITGAVVAAAAVAPASASADTLGQTVGGTTAQSIALSAAVPAAFALNFNPGGTASSTLGTISAVTTNASWSLTAADTANGGVLQGTSPATLPACTGSDAALANPMSLALSGVSLPGVSLHVRQPMTNAAGGIPVAAGVAAPLPLSVFSTDYQVVIPSSQVMTTGCTYTTSVTYTLQ